MKIGFVIYDRMTSLDFVGCHDPISRLKLMGFIPDLEWDVCAIRPVIRDVAGLGFKADKVGEPLGGYDAVVVPGGGVARTLKDDAEFIEWLRTAAPVPLKISVCTGALLLGAAGFLEGRNAATHPSSYDILETMTPKTRRERIVDEGNLITTRGVTSSIDLGLYLCEKFAGPEARAKIQETMDYPYQPPPPFRP